MKFSYKTNLVSCKCCLGRAVMAAALAAVFHVYFFPVLVVALFLSACKDGQEQL